VLALMALCLHLICVTLSVSICILLLPAFACLCLFFPTSNVFRAHHRLNWCGATLAEDPFGAALLENGVPEAAIRAWLADPQVRRRWRCGKMGGGR